VTANLAAAAEPRTGNIVEARNLVKSFGETPALRGASLTVRRGEIVAVMGPSGSGKSTLLHCLAGILVPGQGEVWFDRQRLDTLSDERRSALRRDRFGFVFQSGQLVPELTVEENVALPLLLSGTRRGPAMTAGDAEAAAGLAAGAAAGLPGRARLLDHPRPPGRHPRTGPGIRIQLRAHHRRPVHRGPVAHHGRGAGHGPVDQPPRHADRRPAPR
jgi:ABC-type sugar transport system ATPase subunit